MAGNEKLGQGVLDRLTVCQGWPVRCRTTVSWHNPGRALTRDTAMQLFMPLSCVRAARICRNVLEYGKS